MRRSAEGRLAAYTYVRDIVKGAQIGGRYIVGTCKILLGVRGQRRFADAQRIGSMHRRVRQGQEWESAQPRQQWSLVHSKTSRMISCFSILTPGLLVRI